MLSDRYKNVRNVAIILALAVAVWKVPGGGTASNTIQNIFSVLFTAGLFFLGYRVYMERRMTIFGLPERQRGLLADFLDNLPVYFRQLEMLTNDESRPWLKKLVGEGLGSAEQSIGAATGIERLDAMIVTHNDIDHSGGAASVLENFDVAQMFSSLPAGHPLLGLAERLGVVRVNLQRGKGGRNVGFHWDLRSAPGL